MPLSHFNFAALSHSSERQCHYFFQPKSQIMDKFILSSSQEAGWEGCHIVVLVTPKAINVPERRSWVIHSQVQTWKPKEGLPRSQWIVLLWALPKTYLMDFPLGIKKWFFVLDFSWSPRTDDANDSCLYFFLPRGTCHTLSLYLAVIQIKPLMPFSGLVDRSTGEVP